jgi:predicted ATPase
LRAQLRSRRTLLLLDNCEHLLPSCADIVADMLQNSWSLRVLATSREALAVPGEVIFPVPPLEVPPKGTAVARLDEFSAARLFIDRARAVKPGFTITEANAPALTEIVTRLDGIPLAVELAAARVRLLSPEQIADRLSDRFRLLSAGARTVLPRQQTLRGAIDWSYELLDETERAVLRRLAVFAGSWTVEAAATVCTASGVQADILDVLGRLVDKSLAMVLEGAEENRFGLLETVRQYAAERLLEAGETDQTSAAHRDWCCALVEAAAAHLGGADQVQWLESLEAEQDNISAALAWSISGNDPNGGLRIAIGAAWFWYLRGHWDEANKWFSRSLAVDSADRTLQARGEAWAALFNWRRQQMDAARQLATCSQASLDGTAYIEAGLCLMVLTLVAISEQELDAADAYCRKALEVFREQGHAWGTTTALLILTRIAIYREAPDSDALLTESAALLDSGPDRWGKAQALNLRGYEAFRNLDLDRAYDLYTASHALAVELGDTAAQAENLLALGHVHLLRAENEEAARVLEKNRRLLEELQDNHQLGHADQALALVAIAKGQVAEGEALFGEVTRRFKEMGVTGMGGSDALATADLYRRAGRPTLAGALLRHALTLIDPNQRPSELARAKQELAASTPREGERHEPERRNGTSNASME